MKKSQKTLLFFIFLCFVIISCAKIFKKIDVPVEVVKENYIKLTIEAENIHNDLIDLDLLLAKPVYEIYYDYSNDTFTKYFNDKSETEQVKLLKADKLYKKLKSNYANFQLKYSEITNDIENQYYNYEKIKGNLIQAEDITKATAKVITEFLKFKK